MGVYYHCTDIYIASFSDRPLQTKQVSECHGSGVLDQCVEDYSYYDSLLAGHS